LNISQKSKTTSIFGVLRSREREALQAVKEQEFKRFKRFEEFKRFKGFKVSIY
jgi:hypothetical protein